MRMSGSTGARRAVAYIRAAASTLERAETDPAPGSQRAAIETWAAREDVEIASWQLDLGVDGTTPIAERPGLVAAYRAIREYGAGMLVAANADRFAHDELVSWLIERAALTEGATLHTADGSRGQTRMDAAPDSERWTRGAVRLAHAYRRVVVRSRIRASLAAKKERGERIGTVPYGCRLSADRLHVEPDEAEVAVVTMVRQLSCEGLSQRAIAAYLRAHGVTGRTGSPLGQTQVANILHPGR